jgi:hypothetical protein
MKYIGYYLSFGTSEGMTLGLYSGSSKKILINKIDNYFDKDVEVYDFEATSNCVIQNGVEYDQGSSEHIASIIKKHLPVVYQQMIEKSTYKI